KLLGGNPEKSLHHFQEHQKLMENKFLMSYFLQAKTYAVQIQDRELFEKLLKKVLETPSDVLPEQRLANEVAKMKAEKLLERADDLF
ncbi:MAG: TRAP transporter TatT component family protein, partial [Nitrospinales bacterium]